MKRKLLFIKSQNTRITKCNGAGPEEMRSPAWLIPRFLTLYSLTTKGPSPLLSYLPHPWCYSFIRRLLQGGNVGSGIGCYLSWGLSWPSSTLIYFGPSAQGPLYQDPGLSGSSSCYAYVGSGPLSLSYRALNPPSETFGFLLHAVYWVSDLGRSLCWVPL